MDLSVSLPLDNGFLRRECPHCERQFKWHHGATDTRPENAEDPLEYFCPYCGRPSPLENWWTSEQVEFIEQNAAIGAADEVSKMVKGALSSHRNGLVKLSASASKPNPPLPLVELSDMLEVQSPCHAWEPIKIYEDWLDPLHCLFCGTRFVFT